MLPGAVEIAEHAIRSFAGNINRAEAGALLTIWQFGDKLTSDEYTAVLDRFNADPEPVLGKDFLAEDLAGLPQSDQDVEAVVAAAQAAAGLDREAAKAAIAAALLES